MAHDEGFVAKEMKNNSMYLKNGAQIAIIGGGPAGCFFANFANRLAKQLGLDISTTIFEWRDFTRPDKTSCNMSVGVLAENLLKKLDSIGITIPDRCIQTEIEGYHFMTQEDRISLQHPKPGHRPRIVTVFRGAGPIHSHFEHDVSFDNFMLTTARERGANIIHEEIKDVILPQRPEDKATVIYGRDARELRADLVVGAFGINTPTMKMFEKMHFGYVPPRTIRTCIIEAPLDRAFMARKHDTNVIHVFAFGMKEVEFASLTPRGEYLTVAIVGKKDISTPHVKQFLSHPAVLRVLPQGVGVLKNCCICFPKISVSTPAQPYSDRLVIIGDAGVSRSYKNGIESAFVVAQLAANTAFQHGVSKEAFRRGYYEPACHIFTRDNRYAKVMFRLFDLFASREEHYLSEGMSYAEIHRDQWVTKQLNDGLWKLVTGDAPYKEIFMELFSPRLQFALLPVTIGAFTKFFKEYFGMKAKT